MGPSVATQRAGRPPGFSHIPSSLAVVCLFICLRPRGALLPSCPPVPPANPRTLGHSLRTFIVDLPILQSGKKKKNNTPQGGLISCPPTYSKLRGLQGPENIRCKSPQGQMYMGEGQRPALSQQPKGSRTDEKKTLSWAWPIFPVVGKLRPEDSKSLRPAWATQERRERKRKGRPHTHDLLPSSMSLASSPGCRYPASPFLCLPVPKKGALTCKQRSGWEAQC